jgi:hypothetical protein
MDFSRAHEPYAGVNLTGANDLRFRINMVEPLQKYTNRRGGLPLPHKPLAERGHALIIFALASDYSSSILRQTLTLCFSARTRKPAHPYNVTLKTTSA